MLYNALSVVLELQRFGEVVHGLARDKGWWPSPACTTRAHAKWCGDDFEDVEPTDVDVNLVLAKLALIASEVGEAIEAVREGKFMAREECGKPEGLAAELSDIIIRVLDLGEALGLDVSGVMVDKHEYNKTRPHRHGDKLA